MHILRAGVERVAAGAGIIVGDAAARLHCDGGDAVVVEGQPRDVMRPGKDGLDDIAITYAHRERGVVGRTFMDQWRAGPHCILGAHHRGQHLVIDRHQLRRIARQCFRRGDHDCDALADIAHTILRQRRKLGAEALRSAHVLSHELGIEGAEPVGRPLLAGQHCVNAGQLLRRSFVDGADARMSMRRRHKDRVRLPSEIDVGDIPPLPGQEPAVFLAGNRLSDAKAHAALSFSCVPRAYSQDRQRSVGHDPAPTESPVAFQFSTWPVENDAAGFQHDCARKRTSEWPGCSVRR